LPFSILELVAGNRIDKHCDDARLDIAHRLGLFVQLCDAVQCLHEHGFLHNDLKPANILVEAHNVVRLVDFDSAVPFSAASHGSNTGPKQEIAGLTLSYASPEAHQGLRLTPASDVYSLGVVLYELLVEASPHRPEGNLLNQLADSVLYDTPDSPSKAVLQGISERPSDLEAVALRRRTTARQLADGFSGDLDNIVLTALEKNPSKRYRSVSEFSSDLQAYIAGKHVRASTLRAEIHESQSAPCRLTCRLRTFLSYATDDRPQVHGLYKRLQSVNAEPWMDIEDLLPGQKWESWVKDAIKRVAIALVCLSPRSVTKVGYIQKELRYILDRAAEQPENKTWSGWRIATFPRISNIGNGSIFTSETGSTSWFEPFRRSAMSRMRG
jgi:serine/threonine protein kinase